MRSLLLMLVAACASPPAGLRATPNGDGPLVRVDWDAKPLPDVPFPNDLATRPDPLSPTGLRLNLPEVADTEIEVHSRELLNGLSGFGVFSPITVGFEARLDLDAVLARHPDDFHDPKAFRDDAIYLLDVDPDSPQYLQPVPLEIGHGRFPQDAAQLGSFLANDPRWDQPSLLFETADEDLDGDGALDPGEDTDGDGLLDEPNLWPPGGDARDDLLTWYDLQTDTLFLRPVVPLREETTYALVLTEALVGLDGQPVRSPWEWVNHTRQTEALGPVVDALGALGRDVDDIAFTWSFTTGTITTELWEVAEGLRGRGQFSWLADQYPPGVTEGHDLHTLTDGTPPMFLPTANLLGPLEAIGFLPPESYDLLSDIYTTYTEGMVGGTIVSPDLLYDRDDLGRDDSDEHWVVDAQAGTLEAKPRRIAFSCAIPKETAEHRAPFPVVIHAHGYGSARVEMVAFAYALNRMGMAVCSLDAPGQGVGLDEESQELVGAVLQVSNAEPLWWHVLDNRVRDLDNDGVDDPAGDAFPADAFHARDNLRQPVLDWVQLIRSLKACGTGEMERVTPTADGPVYTGEKVKTCDWDGDGAIDLGGPDTEFRLHGVSQGGIMTSLSIAIQEASTAVVTVPGGGLPDVVGRTALGSVTDGMIGRALSPLIIGRPQADGSLQLNQVVIRVDEPVELPIGSLPAVPVGGRVVVRNLDVGKEESGPIPSDGSFRVAIAANAPDAKEKALLTGIPEDGVGMLETYGVADNAGLGDRLEIEVLDATGATVATFDEFGSTVVHEGVTYEAGSPLVAGSWGLGMRRGSPDLRRLVTVLGIAIEPGDPIAYARRWADEPFAEPKRVMIHLTAGDDLVPIASGLALARAAGLVDYDTIDPRWGSTADRFLIDHEVVHGLEEYGPYVDAGGSPILFDPDDLDVGADLTGAPTDTPLRASRATDDGLLGLRVLYIDPRGTHAYYLPDQSKPFDWNLFSAQQMSWFLATDGAEISDDPCMATRDCAFLPPLPEAE